MGYGRHLTRFAPTPDRSVPGVSDHRGVPGRARLPGPHRCREGQVLGRNAAALLGVDPEGITCAIDVELLAASKGELRVLVGDGLVPNPYEPVGYATRREVLRWRRTTPKPSLPV